MRKGGRNVLGNSTGSQSGAGRARIEAWFAARGWLPHDFQRATWDAYAAGSSGLVNVATGAGKTYAAFLGPLAELIDQPASGITVLYVSPLRAVSRDVELAFLAPVTELGLPFLVETRTGDTTQATRAKQRSRLPSVLVTTPESLSLFLTHALAAERFASLRCVIVDEWHELMGTKRGTQTELALARLRKLAPHSRTWALSATIANLDEAARTACGLGSKPVVVRSGATRDLELNTLLPDSVDAFPWAGHLGLAMVGRVVEVLKRSRSTLVFTNTRSQAERWYDALASALPDWGNALAVHHGSLDRDERERVEQGLKSGAVRAVVCTASLDLGVDFGPVQEVVQLGSVKSVARLLQRAGRSAHRPGEKAVLSCAPTHAFELIEIAAARDAMARGEIERRTPLHKPLDVLVQHLVTCALGGGFAADELLDELRTTVAYADLTRAELDWTIELAADGGKTLQAYPEYKRLVARDGRYLARDDKVARMHRMNIGTIASDTSFVIKTMTGKALGSVEEQFLSKLKTGEVFRFGGKDLEVLKLRDMTAYVRAASRPATVTPRWLGGRLPWSAQLSQAVRRMLDAAKRGERPWTEMEAVWPVLEVQMRLSALPALDEVLIESTTTRDGHHLFVFPFEGRLVHEGLAAIVALRLSRRHKATFAISVNDYGFELLTHDSFQFASELDETLFSPERVGEDALESVNVGELARRQFRDIARVAGLIVQGYPGRQKTAGQLQASGALIYDVFARYDPENLLLAQARREVMEQHFEESRLVDTLRRLSKAKKLVVMPRRPTPLALPLLVERVGARLSSESLLERIERLKRQWQTA